MPGRRLPQRQVSGGVSAKKPRHAAKVRKIRESLIAGGCTGLVSQAAMLGLPRNTAFTILIGTHGISARIIARCYRKECRPLRWHGDNVARIHGDVCEDHRFCIVRGIGFDFFAVPNLN
jgi:hypothetical protein